MQATSLWLRTSPFYSAIPAAHGVADLRFYNAEYCEWGSGEPLVLVPGLAGGIELIEPIARRLALRYRVIAYQLRGENDCFALRRRFNIRDLRDDLHEFIQWRGLERPRVVGISFGAVIAAKFAARYPKSLSALAMQGIGLRFESGLVQRIADMVLSSYPIPDNSRFINQFFNILFGQQPAAAHLEHAVRTCWQTDQSVMSHRLRLLRRLDLLEDLLRINVPTMLVRGKKDILVSSENARKLVESLRDGQLTSIERAGHLAAVSHSNELSAALCGFFASAEV